MSRQILTTAFVVLTSLLVAHTQAGDDGSTGKRPRASSTAELRAGYVLAPKAFRAAAAKVRPALVMIETFGGVAPVKKKKRGRAPRVARPGDGPTTGLIVSSDGYVLTSTFNFITRPPIITVIRQDGSRHVAKLLGRDDARKICLLKVDGAKNWPTAKSIADDSLKVGQWAVTVGLGYGKEPVISAGIISAKNRIGGRAVQTDANISPENYGGPLLDVEGRVIGLCVPLNPRSQATAAGVEWYNSGIGFAIPLADAGQLIDAMKSGQTIRPAALGVGVKPAKGKPFGVDVGSVRPHSAADKAGLRTGDRIVALGKKPVASPTQLRFRLARFMAGEKAEVAIVRDGKRQKLNVTLDAAKPAVKTVPRKQPKRTPAKSKSKSPK